MEITTKKQPMKKLPQFLMFRGAQYQLAAVPHTADYVDDWYTVYDDPGGSTYHAHECVDGSMSVEVDNAWEMSFDSKREWNKYIEAHKLKCVGADHS